MCPFYLLCGMTYEQYWYASPYLVITYRELHRLRNKQINEQLWMQGAYFYEGVSVIVSNILGKKDENAKYPEKPFDILPKSSKEIEEERNQERAKAVANLNAWKQAMENKYGRNNNILTD